jgi:putative phosphoesterase
MPLTIGLIADTHGRCRPGVTSALSGVDLILHAGDVGSRDVLVELRTIAPVQAVYGNMDDPWDPDLAEVRFIEREGWTIALTHGHLVHRLTPEALLRRSDTRIVVFGHTHRPAEHWTNDRLAVNPGAAGPRRFDITPSVARLVLSPDQAVVTFVPVD